MSSNGNLVKLDIGGTIFKTSKSTLTKYDGMFKAMIETEIPVAKDDADSIFIDRSAEHFNKILNFMRDGETELPESTEKLKEIRKEAQYYLLDGLVELCNVELAKREKSKMFDENVQVLDTDGQMLQIMNRVSEKPSLIIYYHIGANSRCVCPDGFIINFFLRKYNHKLDIYFKSFKHYALEAVANPTIDLQEVVVALPVLL